MSHDGHTISLPKCEPYCDIGMQPERNLILGVCVRCGHHIAGRDAVGVLRALKGWRRANEGGGDGAR